LFHRLKPALRGDDAAVREEFAIIDKLFQMQRAPVADDVGGSLSKAGTDFLRRGGNDIVEALSDGVSVPQADHDLGALLRRESRGESGIALQVGPIDETKNLGIVYLRIIVFRDRAAREHGGDTEGNAHLGLQRIPIRSFGIAAGVARRRLGDADQNAFDVLRFRQFVRSPQCRLRGGLREVAGRSRLVVDGHDFRLPAAKQPDSSGGVSEA